MKQQAIYQKNQKITALYCRLSRDDGTQDDSSSIQTQKAMLSKYASDHGYWNTRFFVDDGYSGTNFNRPAFQELISEVKANRVERVITKDLSRLGRNYLETGRYIEVFFPNHKVQYIAINDGVDSSSYQSMDITPFKNILNELYAADVSKKVRSARKTKSESGQFTGASAPFGYQKDPENHNHLVIDERYAPVVRRVFQWAAEGAGIPTIRNRLREEKVPRPSACSTMNYTRFEETEEKRYEWSNNSVRNILRNPTYAGHLVAGRRPTLSMKSKKRGYTPFNESIMVYNTHEGIVSQEQYDLVQFIITSRNHENRGKAKAEQFPNIFAGLVKCADCGEAMTLTRAHRAQREEPIDCYVYYCNRYKQEGKAGCTAHKIEARDLYEAVLGDIQAHAQQAVLDDHVVLSSLKTRLYADELETQKAIQAKARKAQKRLEELDTLFEQLYEDRAAGRISERNFTRLSAKYEQEQAEQEQLISEAEKSRNLSREQDQQAKDFVELIRPYAGIRELDAATLNTLIERITVSEPEVVNGEIRQKITICYHFIGSID